MPVAKQPTAAAAQATTAEKLKHEAAAAAAASHAQNSKGAGGSSDGQGKLSEAQKRALRKQKKKQNERLVRNTLAASAAAAVKAEGDSSGSEDNLTVEYVASAAGISQSDPNYEHWKGVFEHFLPKEEEQPLDADAVDRMLASASNVPLPPSAPEEKSLSKRRKKLMSRLSVAELKQLVEKPEVVEAWDVTAQDPRLLVHLKGTRNTVPVPRHWSNKRKYLQGKRGIEKAPFALPEFIAATGIARIRETYKEKEDQKTMKQKARERMQPKMAKMDIDYNVLHDAFFRYQTKPKLIGHADLYHEGKEFEISFRDKRPGVLSADLRKALGMPPSGPFPPPWLRKMQLYGPPPSYPGMKIPGLNAPIPAGAQWGMQYGGWGKAPVDERGMPLYGDLSIFNPAPPSLDDGAGDDGDKVLWGELEAVEEEQEEEIAEEEEEEEDDDHKSGIQSTLPSGMDTPSQFELRKGLETPESTTTGGLDTPSNKPGELFRELRQEASSVGGALMGSSFRYVIPTGEDGGAAASGKKRVELLGSKSKSALDSVDVALDPSEMEGIDEQALKDKYDDYVKEQRKANSSALPDDSYEDEKKNKKKKQKSDSKKDKDFRF